MPSQLASLSSELAVVASGRAFSAASNNMHRLDDVLQKNNFKNNAAIRNVFSRNYLTPMDKGSNKPGTKKRIHALHNTFYPL